MKLKAPQNGSLFEILQLLYKESSKTTLRSWIKDERVFVGNVLAKRPDQLVQLGEIIEIRKREIRVEGGIKIVYQDKDLVVIEKPAGLLSVAAAFEKVETAHALLKKEFYLRRVHVVHRLDQETSGLMLFAFSEEARDLLKDIFERHEIEREYTAIVQGAPSTPSGTWQSYLFEDSKYHVHSSNDPDSGELAITHYSVEERSKIFTKLILTLETGKKNQIRVHCQDAGCPIVGDKKYGSTINPLRRLCLHAHRLAFQHPVTKKKLDFRAPAPYSFNKIMKITDLNA